MFYIYQMAMVCWPLIVYISPIPQNTVHYNMILQYKIAKVNIGYTNGASDGVSLVNIWKKIDHIITKLHYDNFSAKNHQNNSAQCLLQKIYAFVD